MRFILLLRFRSAAGRLRVHHRVDCEPDARQEQQAADADESDAEAEDADQTKPTKKSANENKKKTAAKDDDFGLSVIKVYGEGKDLTEDEKLIVRYFDNDYLSLPGVADVGDLLQRYPQVFEGAQIDFTFLSVVQILKTEGDRFTAYARVGDLTLTYDYGGSYGQNSAVIIKGTYAQEKHLIAGDVVTFRGVYNGMKPYNINGGTTYLPEFETISYLYDPGPSEIGDAAFTYEEIKKIATRVFGEDINVREITFDEGWVEGNPPYVVEPENQSNANFTKYMFFDTYGRIEDMRDLNSNGPISREITFTPDFRHYILSAFDKSLNTFTLSYYDTGFKKVWSREFADTSSVGMDYTANHIYLVANQKLYIINAEDGSDALDPKFVGIRTRIHKLSDGLVMTGGTKADAVVKTDLEGNVLWSVSLQAEPEIDEWGREIDFQLVDDHYVVQYYSGGKVYFMVLSPDGKTLMNAEL